MLRACGLRARPSRSRARAISRTSTRRELALLLARLDARQVEQVDDELAHALDADEAAVDHPVVRGRVVAGGAVLQDVQVALDGRQRRLQLVREDRDELEADLALLLRPACGPAAAGCRCRGGLADRRLAARPGVNGLARKSYAPRLVALTAVSSEA